MGAQLRVYPDSPDLETENTQDPSIRIRLADLLPLLALAKKNNYIWLHDFLEDEVTVTPDLDDVIRSFGEYRRPA